MTTIQDVIAAENAALAAIQGYVPPAVQPPPVQSPPPSTGNATLAALAPNTLKCLVDHMPFVPAPGEPASVAHVTDQSGIFYDDDNYCLHHGPGGGHAGVFDDGHRRFNLATLAWSEDYPRIPYADRKIVNFDGQRGLILDPRLTDPNSQASGPFPRPIGCHTETLAGYIPWLKQFVLVKGADGNGQDCVGDWPMTQLATTLGPGSNGYATAWACNGGWVQGVANGLGGSSGEIAHYHLDPNDPLFGQWTTHGAQRMPGFPKALGEQQYGWQGMAIDAQSKLCWIFGRDAILTYDPATFERKRVKVMNSMGAMGVAMALAYYPPTDKWYWCAHFAGTATNPPVFRFFEITLDRAMPGNTTIKQVSPTGTAIGQSNIASTTEMAFDTDPATNIIWTGPFVNGGVISFTYFDPATMSVGSVSPLNATDGALAPGYILFHNGRFDRRTGAWIWIDNRYRTWAWKPPLAA